MVPSDSWLDHWRGYVLNVSTVGTLVIHLAFPQALQEFLVFLHASICDVYVMCM